MRWSSLCAGHSTLIPALKGRDKLITTLRAEITTSQYMFYRGDLVCPNWFGIIDVEEATLVFFAGGSG